MPLLPHLCPLGLLTHLCPLGVPRGGGGYVGYIRKVLEMGYLEHPGLHALLTTCFRFSSVLDGVSAACCLFLHTNSRNLLLLPLMHHKSLWFTKGLTLGVQTGRVTRHPAKGAKNPRTGGSQQPACSHEEHQILSTAEAMPLNTGWVPVKACRLQD